MKNVIWFINFTLLENSTRTTETKVFSRKKDAVEYSTRKRGYIIRQDDSGNTLDSFFGGFSPSAQEQQTINNLLGE